MSRAIAAPRSRRSSALRRGRKNERLSRTLAPEPAGGAARRGSGRHGHAVAAYRRAPDDQIATEAQRRADVMQSPPRTPQLLCRLTDQLSDFAINRCQCQTSSRSFRPRFAPRGSPECWRAEASWSGVFMGSPARRYGTPGRAPLWPRQEGARAFSSRLPRRRRARYDAASRSRSPPRQPLPLGRRSIAITTSCLEGGFGSGCGSGSGKASIADHG